LLPNLLILMGVIGVALLLTRFNALGRKLLVGSFIALAVCGVSPLGSMMMLPLEERFPVWTPSQGEPDGIVILGGGIDPDISAARGVVAPILGIDRLITAVKLARQYPRARLIYSGGSGNLFSDAREADYARQMFSDLGILPERLVIDRNSRNTMENVEYSKALAAPKPGEQWLLVTSAFHMPRSVGLFRKAEFPVEAVPTDWQTRGGGDRYQFVSFVRGIERVSLASREWIGLFAYWITGKISEPFPGPRQV
jgi:uncharacterized SAM-binding protein YcdF (DUF218 family)